MKQYMKNTVVMAVLLLTTLGTWAANEVTINTNGKGTTTSQVSNGVCTLTVTPADGEYCTAENITAVKTVSGGSAQAPGRRSPGVDNTPLTVTATNPDADPSGVTTYTITMPGDDYDVEVTVDFQTLIEINPAVTLTGWTYGENPNTPVVTGNTGSGTETFTYATKGGSSYSETVPTDAGEYTVKVSIAAAGKYAAGEATAEFTIGKAAITPVVTLAGWTYGAEANTPSVSGNTGNGAVTYTYKAAGATEFTTTVPTAAGTHTVKATIAETDNYQGGEATAEFTIGKAVITPTVTLAGWTYGAEPNTPSVEGNAGDGTVTYSYKAAGATEFTATVPTAAGTHTVKATIAETANYQGAEATAEFTIGKAMITPTVTLAGWTYGAEPNTPSVEGNAGDGTVTYSYKAAGATEFTATVPTAAGTHTVKATIAETANYQGAEATAEFTIGKAMITPTVTLAGWTYGAEPNTPSVEGNAGDGTVTYSYKAAGATEFTATVPTAAGTHTVKATIAETANYLGGEATAEFTITAAGITLTKAPAAIADLTYTGEAQALITAGEVTAGELQYSLATDGQYSTAIPTATNAGTYTVYYKVVADANYTTPEGGEVTASIAKAAITPSVTLAGWTYGAEPNAPAVAGNVGKGEETITYASKGSDAFSATQPSAAGTYVVKVVIAETANYQGGEATAEFTITAAGITLTKAPAAIADLTYTGEAQALITAGEVTAGELQYSLATDGQYSTAIPTATNAGTYTVYYKVVADANYTTPEGGEVTASIAKAAITPSVTLAGWTYGAEPNAPAVAGNVGKGEETITYASKGSDAFSATQPSAAGTYVVKVVIAETANYQGGEATAEFTITAAGITLTKAPAAIADLTYTGEAQALITAGEVTAGELQYSLAADGQYSTAIPTATNAGTYTVYYKVVADANYTLPEGGSVEVTIAKATPELEMTNESMTLDAHETAKSEINGVVVKLNGSAISGDFTFTYESSDENVATVNANGGVQAVGVGEAVITVKGPIGDANLNETSVTYTVSVFTTYGISIYKDERLVAINNDNRNDVFGDGTVKFDGRQTLILEDAHFTGTVSAFITTSLEELKIFLKGNNTFEGPGRSIETSKNNGTLTFTTEGNTPGTVTMKNTMAADTAKVISGFSNILFEQNLTVLSGAADQSAMMIGTPVAPIVDKNDEEKTVDVAKVASASTETLSNTTIDNVLYTLKEESDGTGDKVDEADNCIVLASTMIDDDVDETVTTLKPGTDEFAQAFQGLTFMVPAGTGKIIVNVKTGEEGVLNVKIGDDEPYAIEDALDFTDFEFPYACAEATYVYIYNASKVVAAAPSHRAGKKTSITVGVRTVGVQASETQASNAAASAVESGEEVVENSDEIQVSVSNGTAAIDNLGVVELPADFFADMAYVNTIDLRKTSISGMVVSRSAGVFKKVSKNTFIYLPSGNNTEESNVVFGKICPSAVLDADMPESESFGPADAFTAKQVVLDRIFKKDETATVYLPFAIDLGAAADFGTFYTFEGVENGKVKIEEVKTDLMANVPYIFKSKDDGVQIDMKAVKVSMPDETAASPARRAGTEDGLYGCYKHQTSGDGTLYKMVAGETIDDLQFVRMTAGDVVKPFQAYLKLNGDQADSIGVTGGTTTGISNVMVTSADNDEWQSMSGLRLQKKPSAKGVYINKGKKVVVK